MYLSKNGSAETFKMLIDAGADVNAEDMVSARVYDASYD